ncbi:hypothetical protein Y032_0141g2226 [Ancylostoma ceylanicum]|uniref:NADAR domain-containing protein n=1 Tax=Ancylostoma ceylanicum TaxID=53326 RepID=A0A016T409_9BILA|nr:hypothetical protein Y032_0141g2226 [Ancylostoma ceylanicum]
MDEGKIVLIGNESDVLHCGYSHAISDAGKRYPSAVHYTHSMILSQLGVDENVILELLCTSACDVPLKARQLLLENMPAGHDMNSLASYLQSSKQAYSMQGLRLRVEQDKLFEKALMNTKDALLIVCDPRDKELGIGMDENQFLDWMAREKADSQMVEFWMKNETAKPPALGGNQMGFFLMWLRFEVREKRKAAMLNRQPLEIEGLSTDNDDNPIKIKVNDQIISLQGIFRPLSNYYPLPFEMKGERYRSVEHYAYEKLFIALKLDDKCIEKIQTTVLPADVAIMARRYFKKQEIPEANIEAKMAKMDRWRQSAMKHKIAQNEYLQQLLLSTGDALLIDCCEGDPMWTCASSEREMQRLLTKPYVGPADLIKWMRNKDEKTPKTLAHLVGNKTGLLLMELRVKLASQTESRIPLISHFNTASLSSIVSSNVICFTAESVFHPLYPAEIRVVEGQPLFASPAHFVASQAVKYLGFNTEDAEYVMETESSLECWERLHETIEAKGRGLEREQSWWMERRQKAIKDALALLFEQHPPVLRALLDTGDAMLVYCARFCSMETELSIGMRESDLRAWLYTVDISSKQLLELCTRPMAFRPSYLGGNRLGLILMELRREFVLRGAFPHTLPELPISVDIILGTDSPTESMMVSEPFDILCPDNYTALWISEYIRPCAQVRCNYCRHVSSDPLFILAKEKKDADLMNMASWVKIPPRLITVDDSRINGIVEELLKSNGRTTANLRELPSEDMRAIFMKLTGMLRLTLNEVDTYYNDMQTLSVEVNRMQVIRRGLEDTHERERRPERAAAGRERFIDRSRDKSPIPSLLGMPVGQMSNQRRERDYKIPSRRRSPFGDDRRRRDMERRGRSPPHRNNDTRSPVRRQKPATPPPPPQPKPPKQPKVVERELSDGEIVSSDED